ncbi:respiratory nitrate reductase subunit gamma [Thermodesulfobacterium sp. TA1]|uniref:TmcC family electron transfer complex membrane anchor subunit n=1 Tax=Thermodesulfobacterium sp. TA1 TaxID=2234087 RepID=UPI001232C1A3|nr:respiratory nitrate reductase subunit gamma [Thermodesulfobacterium sp. TA1]QER42660.1 respiratory nitrate reductase subunit gamma [Thermodesulfobacterium sp. TA1]
MSFFELVRGPLAWAAFLIFLLGSVYNLYVFFKKAQKDKVLYGYFSLKYTLRSYLFWLLPLGSYSMRQRPLFTLISYFFHVGLLLTPIFFLGHIELWKESWGISWWALPNLVSDFLTGLTIICGLILLARRLLVRDAKYLSTFTDYVFLILVILVFLTGFLARYQILFNYQVISGIHILLGEIMLVLIPFTKLSHIFYFWLIRAHTASEFGAVRRSKDY